MSLDFSQPCLEKLLRNPQADTKSYFIIFQTHHIALRGGVDAF